MKKLIFTFAAVCAIASAAAPIPAGSSIYLHPMWFGRDVHDVYNFGAKIAAAVSEKQIPVTLVTFDQGLKDPAVKAAAPFELVYEEFEDKTSSKYVSASTSVGRRSATTTVTEGQTKATHRTELTVKLVHRGTGEVIFTYHQGRTTKTPESIAAELAKRIKPLIQ
jgi:hypothetical protein